MDTCLGNFLFSFFLFFCPLPLSSSSESYGLYFPKVAFILFFSFLLVFICPTRVLFSYQGSFFFLTLVWRINLGDPFQRLFRYFTICVWGCPRVWVFLFFFLSARAGKTSVLIKLQHFLTMESIHPHRPECVGPGLYRTESVPVTDQPAGKLKPPAGGGSGRRAGGDGCASR